MYHWQFVSYLCVLGVEWYRMAICVDGQFCSNVDFTGLKKRLGLTVHPTGDWWRKDISCFKWRQLKLADVFCLTKVFVALVHLILVVKENEGLSQRCQQIDFILILLVFTVNLENLGSSQAKLSNFKFTTGEQLRYESTTCQDVKCYI